MLVEGAVLNEINALFLQTMIWVDCDASSPEKRLLGVESNLTAYLGHFTDEERQSNAVNRAVAAIRRSKEVEETNKGLLARELGRSISDTVSKLRKVYRDSL